MLDHLKFEDRESWKKIGNAVMFVICTGCFMFWLARSPMPPALNEFYQAHRSASFQSESVPLLFFLTP